VVFIVIVFFSISKMSTTISYNGLTITLDSFEIKNIIDSCMVYPKFKNIEKDINKTNLIIEYECNPNKCNLDQVLNIIENNSELKALGVKETIYQTIKTINENQELFTVRDVKGFLFQSTSYPFLYLKNKNKIDEGNARIGFCDYTEIKRKMIIQYEMDKINSWKPYIYGFLIIPTIFGIKNVYDIFQKR
jgi:hypothetical protein